MTASGEDLKYSGSGRPHPPSPMTPRAMAPSTAATRAESFPRMSEDIAGPGARMQGWEPIGGRVLRR